MEIVIPVYSEQDLVPRASEIIRAVADAEFPEHDIKFRPYGANDKKILVFGSRGPFGLGDGRDYIYTYSISQVLSKANTGSVLKAAFQQFITEPVLPSFRPVDTVLVSALDALDFSRPTAIDIETDGVLGKEQTPEEVDVISVAFYQEGHPPLVIHAGWNGFSRMRPLGKFQKEALARRIVKFEKGIYHNGKFDIRVLNRVLGVELVNWFDTMLAHHVLNHGAGMHKLKPLCQRYFHAPEWERDLSKYTKGGGHYEFIPQDKLVEYNGWDVYWTYRLWEFLAPQIEADDDATKNFEFEMSAADFLLDVESYGIPFDMDYATSYGSQLEFEMENAKLSLQELLANDKFNPNSPKQVKEALSGMGWQVGSTNEAAIADVKADSEIQGDAVAVKFCDLLISYRKASKIRGTYALGWAGHSRNGRVHPTFLVHGTTTGRLSSTQPNAQNVPRDKTIRKIVKTHGR